MSTPTISDLSGSAPQPPAPTSMPPASPPEASVPENLGQVSPPSTPVAPAAPGGGPGEAERLDPQPDRLTLESGVEIKIMPLKMRQLFRLLRIVTRGGAQYLPMLREALMGLTGGADDEQAAAFGTQLVAVAVIALPEAEDEAVDFIMSVAEPVNIRTGTDKMTRAHNDAERQKLAEVLYNPEMEDMISIIERVILIEKDDLLALGKRLGQAFKLAMKVDPETQAATENLQKASA